MTGRVGRSALDSELKLYLLTWTLYIIDWKLDVIVWVLWDYHRSFKMVRKPFKESKKDCFKSVYKGLSV